MVGRRRAPVSGRLGQQALGWLSGTSGVMKAGSRRAKAQLGRRGRSRPGLGWAFLGATRGASPTGVEAFRNVAVANQFGSATPRWTKYAIQTRRLLSTVMGADPGVVGTPAGPGGEQRQYFTIAQQ